MATDMTPSRGRSRAGTLKLGEGETECAFTPESQEPELPQVPVLHKKLKDSIHEQLPVQCRLHLVSQNWILEEEVNLALAGQEIVAWLPDPLETFCFVAC